MDTREAVARAIRKAQAGSRWRMVDAADAAIAAHLKALADAGYVVVPREPTDG